MRLVERIPLWARILVIIIGLYILVSPFTGNGDSAPMAQQTSTTTAAPATTITTRAPTTTTTTTAPTFEFERLTQEEVNYLLFDSWKGAGEPTIDIALKIYAETTDARGLLIAMRVDYPGVEDQVFGWATIGAEPGGTASNGITSPRDEVTREFSLVGDAADFTAPVRVTARALFDTPEGQALLDAVES